MRLGRVRELLHDALSFAPHGTASLGAAIASFLVSASWPIAAASWPSILKIIPAALINAPVLILGVRLLKERPGLDDRACSRSWSSECSELY